MKKYWDIFLIISAILGFIVDLVAFFALFGISFITQPKINTSPKPSFQLDVPFDIETVIFVLIIYMLIVTIYFYRQTRSNRESSNRLSAILPLGVIPILFVLWLYGFRYIKSEVYVYLAPIALFSGLGTIAIHFFYLEQTHYRFYMPDKLKNKAIWLYPLFLIGFLVFWFHSNINSISVLSSFGLSIVVVIVGYILGYIIYFLIDFPDSLAYLLDL